MRTLQARGRFAAAILCALLAAPGTLAPAHPARADAGIAPATLPAAGRGTALLTIEEPGRYAVTATSRLGAGLQLVDRETGPGPVAGLPGERDGRLDLFLDRGTYRLVTHGPERGEGETALALRAFRELSGPRPPLLVELKPVAAELADFERRSWWLEVTVARRVLLEAAGRNLADLRLWRDGGWLVDAAPARETLEPEPGRPLRACTIAARLEPGRYLLTAYGGPDEPWAAGGDGHPLHLRFGVPEIGDAGRARRVTSPFGVDHFVVPGSVTFVRIDLPEPLPALLEARPFAAEGNPFGRATEAAEVTKQSREPFAELLHLLPPGAPPRLVTVRARAGQPYLLQHFELRERYPLRASGRYWLGSVHTGHPQDELDATAVVVHADEAGKRNRTPLLDQAVPVDAERAWARRCSLLAPASVFVRVGAAGTYEVLLRGAKARARVFPLFATRPDDFAEPPFQESGGRWRLEAGLHELQLEPVEPGVVEVALRSAGRLAPLLEALDKDRAPQAAPVRAAVTFPEVTLDWSRQYEVRFARRPGVRTGLVLRPLPVDLAQPLPLALRPREEIAVPVAVAEPGALAAEADDGAALEVAVKGGPWGKSSRLGPGRHQVVVRNPGTATVFAALRFAPDRLRAETPLPALPEGRLAPPPAFPLLTEETPGFLDLERRGTATFAVRADAPAFSLLESTGLLATEGTLRTRLLPALARDAGSGTGRNFAIGRYLREGDYQLTVATLGDSAGHLGVRLTRSPVRDGGSLREGVPSRDSVAAGEGLAYAFTIPERGRYRLLASAPGRSLAGRIEDAEGWPVAPPETLLDGGARLFEPGRHRLLLPPEPVASRRVTLLEREAAPVAREGHGPHPLALDERREHLWLESPAGAERLPDRWEFTIAAPATVTVLLTGEMEGVIARRGGTGSGAPSAPLRLHPGRPWSGALPAGDYTLAAVCSRRNNRAPYEIRIHAVELVAGTTRSLTAPGELPVSVGTEGVYELATSGPHDVSARLLDAAGNFVAAQEDRPDDWNVQLIARLAPGAYRLLLDPTGAAEAETTVALRALAEQAPAAVATLPVRRDLHPGDGVALLPFVAPGAGRVLVLRAEAAETVGVALERASGGPWASLWSGLGRRLAVELPLGEDDPEAHAYRLRVWSLDRRGAAVRIQAAAVAPARASERELARGIAVSPHPGFDPPVAVAAVKPARPGLFVAAGGTPWRWAGTDHTPLVPVGPAGAVASGGLLFLAADLAAGAGQADLRAARVALPPGGVSELELPRDGAVSCDLAAGGDGPLLATATSVAGQPGIAILPQGDLDGRRPPALATAAADHAAAALLPASRAAAAVLWRADGGAQPLPVTLRVVAFPEPRAQELRGGLAFGTLQAGEAAALELPRGPNRVRVTLAAGLAAALSKDGRPESAFWAAGGPADETVESPADLCTVVNPGPAAAAWSVELMPLAGRARALAVAPGWPLLAGFTHAGTVRVPVAAEDGAPRTLHVRGATREPLLLGADGRIVRGDRLAAGSGGMLVLGHAPGALVAWAESPGTPLPGLWSDGRPSEERALAPPQIIALKGSALSLRAKAGEPAVLHLRTGLPVILLLRRPSGAPEAVIQPTGARLDLPLEPGTTEIWLRAADGGDLRGRAEATLSPVTAIGEGAGPEAILAAGSARVFSFRVTRAGPVGIGVRAEPDAAACLLLDGKGRTLGAGPVQMPELQPGDYFLAVRAPDGGGPVKVRPALAGIARAPEGPPAEVVRGYLELERSGEQSGAPAPDEAGPAPEEGD